MNLEKVLHWGVVGGVFLLPFIPLIVAQSLFFPFITGKNFTFRIIVELITAGWLVLALVNPDYRPKKSWMLGAFALFIVVIGLADLFGANAFKSIWSNFERMEGWVTLAHLFAYFVVATSVLKTEKLWERLWQTSVGVSVLIGIYGIVQLMGFIVINQGGDRLDATFGNATYLAIYMLFHIFITGLLWARGWQAGYNRAVFGVLYGVALFLQVVILLFTETRGAILGLFAGLFVSAILLAFLARHSKKVQRTAIGGLIGLVVLVGGFALLRDSTVLKSFDPFERLATISLEQNTVQARFMNWGMAWEGFKERPFLGWGQENYNLVFNKYFDPGMHSQEPWFDRVHNVIFDWLIAGGIVGLLSYLALFAIALWYLLRSPAFSTSERVILVGVLAAYGFHNLFVFDNIVSYILFVSILAYITYRVIDARGDNEEAPFAHLRVPQRTLPLVMIIGVVLAAGTVYGVNANAYAANRALLQAVAPQQGGITTNLSFFEESIAYESLGTQEAREQLAQGASRIASNPNVSAEDRQRFLEVSVRELEAQIEAAPEDARFPLFLGTLFGSYGLPAEAQPRFERAHELSPTKQTISIQLGFNLLALGREEEALGLLEETLALAPEFRSARLAYAAALLQTGNETKADELLAPLLAAGDAADQRLIQIYISQERYDKIIEIWESHLNAFPGDAQARFALSATYYAAGDEARAIAELESVGQDVPELRQRAEELIQQIRSGAAQLQ